MTSSPSRAHSYYGYDASFSEGTLPPSSPPDSSSSPIPMPRASSLARGRSKSRGRRVSFKLDGSDKPTVLTPPSVSEDEDAGHAQDAPLSSRASRSEIPANRFRRLGARATSVNAEVATLSEAPKKSDKGKGKALVDPASDPDDSEEDAPLARRGRRHERGCTPGPPSHRERLARASAKKAA